MLGSFANIIMRSQIIYWTDIILGHWASTEKKGICKSYIFYCAKFGVFFWLVGVIWFSFVWFIIGNGFVRICVEVKDFYPSYLLRVNSIKFIGNISSHYFLNGNAKKHQNAYVICIPLCIYIRICMRIHPDIAQSKTFL